MERLPALPETRPRVPHLRLPVEEEVARPVDQAALHHPERHTAGGRSQHTSVTHLLPPHWDFFANMLYLVCACVSVLQVCAGPAASAGAQPARLPAGLQVQVQPQDPAPAQTGAAGFRDAGAGIQQLPAGRRVEEGEWRQRQKGAGLPSVLTVCRICTCRWSKRWAPGSRSRVGACCL